MPQPILKNMGGFGNTLIHISHHPLVRAGLWPRPYEAMIILPMSRGARDKKRGSADLFGRSAAFSLSFADEPRTSRTGPRYTLL
jgi:hypothetical protein